MNRVAGRGGHHETGWTGSLQNLGRHVVVAIAIATVSLTAGWGSPAAAAQRRFDSLEEATQALVDALKTGDLKALPAIFGPEAKILSLRETR